METIWGLLWLTKLILAHLVTDFILQPQRWIVHRRTHGFRSRFLYIHGLITGALAFLVLGAAFWKVALIIFITHTIIDGWKSRQADTASYFIIDQLLHLLIIFGCWWLTFYNFPALSTKLTVLWNNSDFWITATAFIFLTIPAGISIGQITKTWRSNLPNPDALNNAGKWIGIIERCIVFILVLQNQYDAIGLLIAAKGIIRFKDNDGTERKTEYLLIGTLISISVAVLTGLLVITLTR